MSNSALGPAWPQQGLCAAPAFLGAVAVGIMQFAEHRPNCLAEDCGISRALTLFLHG